MTFFRRHSLEMATFSEECPSENKCPRFDIAGVVPPRAGRDPSSCDDDVAPLANQKFMHLLACSQARFHTTEVVLSIGPL